MKTIKQEAEYFANNYRPINPPSYGLQSEELIFAAFKYVAKLANRWIPVEEELPELSKFVIVKLDSGFYEVQTAYLHKENGKFYFRNCNGDFNIKGISTDVVNSRPNSSSLDVTHWKPIELK